MKIKSFVAGLLVGAISVYFINLSQKPEFQVIKKQNTNYLLNNKTKNELKIGKEYVGDINYIISSLEKAIENENINDSLYFKLEDIRQYLTKKIFGSYKTKNNFIKPEYAKIIIQSSSEDSCVETYILDIKTNEKIPIKDYGGGFNIGSFDQKSVWIKDEVQEKTKLFYNDVQTKINSKFIEIQNNLTQFYEKLKETISQ
ncbi:MAG: hypothetical protein QXG00_05610 [Candidatus Woesearchaeota archaeon]